MSIDSPVRRPPTADAPTTRRSFLGGGRAMVPWLAGVVPFGLTIGVTIASSSIDPLAGWATGALIYAGSAQLIAIELMDHGAAAPVVVATVLVVNARLVAYSGAMAPHWYGTGRGFRGGAAYLLVDPSYAVGTDGYRRHHDPRAGHAHYLGGAVTLWVAWQLAIGIGILGARAVPDASLLGLVVPFYLIAEVVRVARTRSGVAAAGVGGAVALVASALPFHAGAVVAIAAGVTVAAVIGERRS